MGETLADEDARQEETYTNFEALGEGVFGTVYSARNRETNEIVALKKFRVHEGEEGVPASAAREIKLFYAIRRAGGHPNILKFFDVYTPADEGEVVYGVFEKMDTDLKIYVSNLPPEKNKKLDPMNMQSISKQLVNGLGYCHSLNIMHRDIKPQNILLNVSSNGILEAKIGDFGLSRSYSADRDHLTRNVVTLWYRAPELLISPKIYGSEIDVWSLGAVLAEVAFGGPLFAGNSEIGTLLEIFKSMGSPTEDFYRSISAEPRFLMNGHYPNWKKNHLFDDKVERLMDPALKTSGLREFLLEFLSIMPEERKKMELVASHNFLKCTLLQGA